MTEERTGHLTLDQWRAIFDEIRSRGGVMKVQERINLEEKRASWLVEVSYGEDGGKVRLQEGT